MLVIFAKVPVSERLAVTFSKPDVLAVEVKLLVDEIVARAPVVNASAPPFKYR